MRFAETLRTLYTAWTGRFWNLPGLTGSGLGGLRGVGLEDRTTKTQSPPVQIAARRLQGTAKQRNPEQWGK